jgi:hypothetical protein
MLRLMVMVMVWPNVVIDGLNGENEVSRTGGGCFLSVGFAHCCSSTVRFLPLALSHNGLHEAIRVGSARNYDSDRVYLSYHDWRVGMDGYDRLKGVWKLHGTVYMHQPHASV